MMIRAGALHFMLERLIAYSPYVGILAALCLGSLGAPIPEEIPAVTAGVLAARRWSAGGSRSRLRDRRSLGRHRPLLGRPSLGEHVLELRLVRTSSDPARARMLTPPTEERLIIRVRRATRDGASARRRS